MQLRKKWLIPLFCLAFVLPVCITGAQESEAEEAAQPTAQPEKAAESEKAEQGSETGEAVKTEKAAPAGKSGGTSVAKNTATGWLGKAVAFISQIGSLFGSALGFRIGGTTGTAVASIAVAKLAGDRMPSWLKLVLYLFGGTMAAGSGGNITQLIMSSL